MSEISMQNLNNITHEESALLSDSGVSANGNDINSAEAGSADLPPESDREEKKGTGLPVAITFSYRRGRVRIYKSVITLLGNPPYIRILINRGSKSVCVQGWTENERDVIEVPEELYKVRKSFGINSKALVRSITDIMGWSKEKSYRINGKYLEEGNLVEFSLAEAVMLTHEKESAEESTEKNSTENAGNDNDSTEHKMSEENLKFE